jgi:hypothetical protein
VDLLAQAVRIRSVADAKLRGQKRELVRQDRRFL